MNHEESTRSATTRTIRIRGNTFGIKEVTVAVIDGMAIFEGDILLGRIDELESDIENAERQRLALLGVGISGVGFRWPNAIVPFTIDASLPNQARVTTAVNRWNSNTFVRLVA